MCVYAQLSVPVDPGSASVARAWVRRQLRSAYASPGAVVDDAELVITELITNALRARPQRLMVELEAHLGFIRVAAMDDAAGHPKPRAAEDTDSTGRGLTIIAALTTCWGMESNPGTTGKTVWARLDPVVGGAFQCRLHAVDG